MPSGLILVVGTDGLEGPDGFDGIGAAVVVVVAAVVEEVVVDEEEVVVEDEGIAAPETPQVPDSGLHPVPQ